MTREDAKAILKDCLYKAEYKHGAYGIALEMAVKALEQEPCKDWYDVPSNEMILERARQASKDLRKRFKEDLEQEPKWIPVSERLPEERGDYLVTQKAVFTDYVYISVAGYALNLYDVDEYDFADKKRAGWYEYDSEWGYHELDGVIAWMPLLTPYKAESEDKE